MGIESLASFLESKGHKTSLCFDPQLFNDGYLNIPFLAKKYNYKKRIINLIRKNKPDLIAFSVLTDNYLWALDLAKSIKKVLDIPIVCGGVHVTSVPDEVMSYDFIDFAVRGEGEYALLELIEALEKRKDYSKIKNLVYRKENKIIKNEVRNLIENLDDLPFPKKELFYKVIPYTKKNYTLLTARGCPYFCTYCFNHMYKKIYLNKGTYLRQRSVENVLSELRLAKRKYNYKFVSIIDDVFMVNDKWIENFCKKYKKEINVPFRCIGHVNCINENKIKFLKMAGCDTIQIGVQTTCENTRKNIIHRYETNETIINAVKIIKKYKIKLEMDHIFGFPYEGEKEQINAAKFYNETRPDIINCYWLKCFPKTDIIPHMIKAGNLTEEDVKNMEKGISSSYILGGSVKNKKDLQKFSSLMNMIPILPESIIDLIIRKKLYYLTNFGTKFLVFSRLIKSFIWRDIRLFEFLYFYKHYIFKSIK